MGSLAEAVIKMPEYFGSKGYQTYDSFISDFFSFSRKNKTEWNIENLEAIIKPIFLKNATDYKLFHDDFLIFLKTMDCRVVDALTAEAIKESKSKKETIEKRIKTLNKKLAKKNDDINTDKLEAAYKSVKPQFELMTEDMSEMRDYKNLKKGKDVEKLKELLKRSMKYYNCEDLFRFIALIKENIDKKEKAKADEKKKEVQEKEREALQKKLNEMIKSFDNEMRESFDIVKKTSALNHRKVFIGKNAVKSQFMGEIFDKRLSQLTQNDKRVIEEYIRENARKFRTKLANKIKTNQKRKLDMPATCKMACKTNGIPMDLRFVKPKKEKSRLVLFLDISGSCSNASEMLLTFMHQMKSVFTNGCETFVFVNSLYDVSLPFTESNSSEEFIKAVFDIVPVKGVYSNYFVPLETFREEYFSKLTKDSIVFFMGDARNNKNETGEEFVKAIARKARKTYWLNTEDRYLWDSCDSIMSVYGKYMNEVCEVTTVGQLLNFLTEA